MPLRRRSAAGWAPEPYGIRTIKRRLTVPVVVDAGVGTASMRA